MCLEASNDFECQLSAVHVGRRWVAQQLRSWGAEDLPPIDDVLLAASELLANAVKFGSGASVAMALQIHRGELSVAVSDDSPGEARIEVGTPLATSGIPERGRGLALVEALALRWGQERAEGQKTVWCAFGLPDGSPLSADCR
jgi:anti-sigma regulatory factor (Ser/Thr protein kinase)